VGIDKAPIWCITGERQAGKSVFCRAISEVAREAGWTVTGLLSPAQIEHGVKIGIVAEYIKTGECRPLASISQQSQEDLPFGNWYFNRQTLAWGNQILESSPPCDLLIIDELGPLELLHQQGWTAAMQVIPRTGYSLAVVVVRPQLREMAHNLFHFTEFIEIKSTSSLEIQLHQCWSNMREYRIC